MAYLIDKYNSTRKDLYSNINKYILKQDEISLPENSNDLLFMKELFNRRIIEKVKIMSQDTWKK